MGPLNKSQRLRPITGTAYRHLGSSQWASGVLEPKANCDVVAAPATRDGLPWAAVGDPSVATDRQMFPTPGRFRAIATAASAANPQVEWWKRWNPIPRIPRFHGGVSPDQWRIPTSGTPEGSGNLQEGSPDGSAFRGRRSPTIAKLFQAARPDRTWPAAAVGHVPPGTCVVRQSCAGCSDRLRFTVHLLFLKRISPFSNS